MEEIAAMLPNFPPEIQEIISRSTAMSYEEQLQWRCERWNTKAGNLIGYDCPDCMNRGGIHIVRSNEIVLKQCHCVEIRNSINRAQQSGLADMLDKYTFDSFQVTQDWQRNLKESAIKFVNDNSQKWFIAGGQVGAGKTHLCTAIVGELLKAGKSARYMLWRDEVVTLAASVTSDGEYTRLINPLKSAEVLYIDDFLKTVRGDDGRARLPTPGDIKVAFEIINHRYNNRSLITIISCEHNIDNLLKIDEAVGSRIYERTKDYCNIINRDKVRNYRMR